MLKLTLFRRQLAILLLVTVVFGVVAMFVSDVAVRAMMNWSSKDDTSGGPTQGFVRLIDVLTIDGKLSLDDAVSRINNSASQFRKTFIRVVDADTLKKEFQVDADTVPADPFQAHTAHEKELRFPRLIVFRAKNSPGKFLVFEREEHGGPGAGGPPPPLPGGPGRNGHGGPLGGPPNGMHLPPPIFFWTFVALVLSGFLAAAISLFFLFSSMRRKARQAADVINAIKKGDWQTRMPIDGVDEVGHLMTEFNRMADEIENAVRSMQRAEASRTGLLQELAHDLRTPIASLRSLIETLEMRNDSLNAKSRGELFTLAQKEIDYFARLIEDLLFLAQVRDPRYLNTGKPVDVALILRDQAERADAEGTVEISLVGLPDEPLNLRGDEVLLKRLVRNAIDNAVSFAKSRVEISVSQSDAQAGTAQLLISILDDGPGFSEQSLSTFGEKRFSRFVGANDGMRLSVGLGSVIMSTVVNVHGGTITAKNFERGGIIVGAEVRISLPTL